MALQFDNSGRVQFATIWTATGDFSITIPSVAFVETALPTPLLGHRNSNLHMIGFLSAGRVTVRINTSSGAGENIISSGHVDGDPIQVTVTRTAGTLELLVNGSSAGTIASTDTFLLNNVGTSNFENYTFGGAMDGVITITGGDDDITYDFDQTAGTTIVPDLAGGNNDGTLTGGTPAFDFFEPSGADITIDSFTEFVGRVKQRDSNGDAVFTVAGDVLNSPSAVEVSQDGGSTWAVLDAAPIGGRYTGVITVNGQQDVVVRNADVPATTATVANVTSAMCIAALGQSNFAGRGINNQPYVVVGSNPVAQMYKIGGTVFDLADPTGNDGQEAGSVFARIAQLYSDAGVPVCIGNIAVGGSKISTWDKSGGTWFSRMTDFYNTVGGIELAVSCIGETDTMDGTSQAAYELSYNNVINDINTDFGCLTYVTHFPVGNTLNGFPTELAAISAGISSIISTNANARSGGDLTVVDIDLGPVGNDGLHLKQDADLSQGGEIVYLALSTSTLNITTTSTPDGSYDAVMWDINGRGIAYNGVINITSDSLSVSVIAPVGATIMGDAYDPAGGDTDGMRLKGVTI
jgi:hypothetical protein